MVLQAADLPTGKVVAEWHFGQPDGPDADSLPDVAPIVGTVTFTCSTTLIRIPGKGASIVPVPIVAEFNSDGNLVVKGGTGVGVNLIATDSKDTNPNGFTWKADFDLRYSATSLAVRIDSFNFQVPVGGTVDLTSVLPTKSNSGNITTQGPKGDPGVVALAALAKSPDLLITGAITRDYNGAVATADVLWPDGTPGTFTTTETDASGAINAYSITYGNPPTATYTQPTITRDSSGAAINVPAITVS